MSSPLLDLPPELFSTILALLDHQDLVAIACASGQLQKQLEPLLWTHIELFPPGYHSWKHIRNVSNVMQQHDRPYRRTKYQPTFEQSQIWSSKWFANLRRLQTASPARASQLGSYTKSLSAPVQVEETDVWQVLPLFSNLETLELVVNREEVNTQLFADDLQLPKLRSVKLFGYVPGPVIQLVLRSASTIEQLAVGALDSSCDLLNFATARATEPDYDDIQLRHIGIDELYDYDSNVDPRPLRWLPEIIPELPKLTRLHLCWPSEMDPREYVWGQVHHFRQLEEACLSDWVRLITKANATLEHLVLDQRPATLEAALEGGDSDNFMRYFSSPSNFRTVKFILPMLRQVEFPRLQSVDFAGLLVHDTLSTDEFQQRKTIEDTCKESGITCRFPLGRRCVYECHSGIVYGVDGMGADGF